MAKPAGREMGVLRTTFHSLVKRSHPIILTRLNGWMAGTQQVQYLDLTSSKLKDLKG